VAVVQPDEVPSVALARRLRELRLREFGRTITQRQLATALSADQSASVALISSWESANDPTVPPEPRLKAYARFFATRDSVAREPFRLPELDDLTSAERHRYDELLDELVELRRFAVAVADPLPASPSAGPEPDGTPMSRLWNFPSWQDIVIVCALLPDKIRLNMPFANPKDPDHIELYSYSDLDSLIELHGHIRAAAPRNLVKIRTAAALQPDDLTSHLVLLGGVDWNALTGNIADAADLPVTQVGRPGEHDVGGFRVDGRDELFSPVLHDSGGRQELVEDVAHFYRGASPYNKKRTVTIFNGMFSRGTLGAVRALTDAKFRDRNEGHVAGRLATWHTVSVVTRVRIFGGQVVTPDWTEADTCLHELPEEHSEYGRSDADG
jgi:hypothetical protein